MIRRFRVWLAKRILPGQGYAIFHVEGPDMEITVTGPAMPMQKQEKV